MGLGERIAARIAAEKRARQDVIKEAQRQEQLAQEVTDRLRRQEEAAIKAAQARQDAADVKQLAPYLEALEPRKILAQLHEYWQWSGGVEWYKSIDGKPSLSHSPVELGLSLRQTFPAQAEVDTGRTVRSRYQSGGGIEYPQYSYYDKAIYKRSVTTMGVGFRISVGLSNPQPNSEDNSPYYRTTYYGKPSDHIRDPLTLLVASGHIKLSIPFAIKSERVPFSLTDKRAARESLSRHIEDFFADSQGILLPAEIAKRVDRRPWYQKFFR